MKGVEEAEADAEGEGLPNGGQQYPACGVGAGPVQLQHI